MTITQIVPKVVIQDFEKDFDGAAAEGNTGIN